MHELLVLTVSPASTYLHRQEGVAVRSGHHCTQPLHALLGLSSSARASLYFYNDEADVDALVKALRQTIAMFEEMRDVQPIL